MHQSVRDRWPAMCSRFEGRCWWMYLDTKRLVTTGLGILLETVEEAQSFPWFRISDGQPATQDEIASEYRRVKNLTELAKRGGFAYKTGARLRLPEHIIDEQLLETTERFWAGLTKAHPQIEEWPADAQLAALDLAWQNGPAFTKVGSPWPNMRAAFFAQDWKAAAGAVPGTHPRAKERKRLFLSAAKFDQGGNLNPGTTVTNETGKPEPVIGPEQPVDGKFEDKAKVTFRGGKTCSCVAQSLPLVEKYMIMMGLIQNSIDIAQLGWRSSVKASAGTHDQGGCVDTWGQWSAAHIDIWRLCGWTMQRRDLTGVNTHAHGWPYGCTHLASAADRQAKDWDRKDAGLQGNAKVVGRWPVDHWQVAYEKRSRELAAFKAGVELAVLEDAFFNGKKHDQVLALQVALNRHLPQDIATDGDPGPQTIGALAKVGELNADTLTKLGLTINP